MKERFNALLKNKPGPGSMIMTKDGVPVNVIVEEKPGMRVMYVNAEIDEECSGWFLTNRMTGLKVLIMPKSQEKLIRGNEGSLNGIKVDSLRVVKHSQKGTALICEVLGVEDER